MEGIRRMARSMLTRSKRGGRIWKEWVEVDKGVLTRRMLTRRKLTRRKDMNSIMEGMRRLTRRRLTRLTRRRLTWLTRRRLTMLTRRIRGGRRLKE